MTLDLSNPEHVEAIRFVCEHFDKPGRTDIQAELIEAVLLALSSPQNICTLLSDIVTDRGYRAKLCYIAIIDGRISVGIPRSTSPYDGIEHHDWPLDRVHTLILALLDAKDAQQALQALRSAP